MSSAEAPASRSNPIALGIDIGGTSIKFGVIDLTSFSSLHEHAIPTPQLGARAMAETLAGVVLHLRESFPSLSKIGVGVPGAMNRDRTVARYPPNLIGWKEEPFKAYLEAVLPGFQIEMDNDAKVATLAEAHLGAGRELEFFIMTTLGTGVGGGIFAEGKIFRGMGGGAGELGMVSIEYDEPILYRGAPGYLEGYIGQEFLSARALEVLRTTSRASVLREYLEGGKFASTPLDPKGIAEAATGGDGFAIEVLQDAGMKLGVAFANVAKLLDILVFVVGGGVAEAGELILGPAQRALEENAMPNQRKDVRILKAELGTRAGVLGAAILVAEHVPK